MTAKHWIATASGGALDLDAPRPEQIVLSDIATGLGNVCRWNGQTPGCRVSVAEHSVIVAQLAVADLAARHIDLWDPAPLVVACLFHDAHEAYPPGDLAAPLKDYLRARGNTVIDEVCAMIQCAIETRFAIVSTPDFREAVQRYDMQARWLERTQVLMPCDRGWGEELERPRDPHPRVECWASDEAAEIWLGWCHDWGIR